MVTYDSDSSGADDDSFTETNVLLGYASKDISDDAVSHLGGRAEWLNPAAPPSAALARCKVCGDFMVLLLLLNSDLPDIFPGHERRLYVLTCRRRTCRRQEGSVRVLRAVRTSLVEKEIRKDINIQREITAKDDKKPFTSTGIGESLFGANSGAMKAGTNPFSTATSNPFPANPFSTSSTTISNTFPTSNPSSNTPQEPSSPSNLPKTFASALSLNSPAPTYGPVPPAEPWPSDSELPRPYPFYYIVDADYETLDKTNEDVPMPRQTMDIDEAGDGPSSQKEDKDAYESTIDKTFQKFADRLAQNPEQVIRYEFRGQPLLYSKTDSVGKLLAPAHGQNARVVTASSFIGSRIPRCSTCGAGRVFEVQLTPHAITELEAEELSLEGMEWGTVIVGVCERDCQPPGTGVGEVGYIEEWAGVQWEELSEKR